MARRGALAIFFVFSTVTAAACQGTTQATPPASSPAPLLATQVPPTAVSVQPTDTPKPAGDFLQPPLSVDERKGEGVGTEFVQAVLLGQEARARSLMEPSYSATVANLAGALGLRGNPEGGYSVGVVRRVAGQLIVRAAFSYPGGQVTRAITVARVGNDWKITHIDPVS